MCRNRAWGQPTQPAEETERRAVEEHTRQEMVGEDWVHRVYELHRGGDGGGNQGEAYHRAILGRDK